MNFDSSALFAHFSLLTQPYSWKKQPKQLAFVGSHVHVIWQAPGASLSINGVSVMPQ